MPEPSSEKEEISLALTDARLEAETVISWDETGSPATIYTHDRRWIGRLRKLGIAPLRSGKTRTGREWVESELPRNWIRLPWNPAASIR